MNYYLKYFLPFWNKGYLFIYLFIYLSIFSSFVNTIIYSDKGHVVYPLELWHNPFNSTKLNIMRFKGTNGRQKTYEIFHVYCIFYSGFMCKTTAIFGITKDGSFVLNTLASWNCFTCRNLFQNGANDMSECLTCETAFCIKAQNFV